MINFSSSLLHLSKGEGEHGCGLCSLCLQYQSPRTTRHGAESLRSRGRDDASGRHVC